MDDAPEVRRVDGAGEPFQQFGGAARGGPPRRAAGLGRGALLQPPVQGAALQQLHREVRDRHTGRPLVHVDLVHPHDLRVLDLRQEFGLEQEPLNGPRVGGGAGEDHLERDHPVQPQVAGAVHDAHSAAADLGEYLEPADARQPARPDRGRLAAENVGVRHAAGARVREHGRRHLLEPGGGPAGLVGEPVEPLLAARAPVDVPADQGQSLAGQGVVEESGQFGVVGAGGRGHLRLQISD